jgi:hypothetical protein
LIKKSIKDQGSKEDPSLEMTYDRDEYYFMIHMERYIIKSIKDSEEETPAVVLKVRMCATENRKLVQNKR